MEAANNFSVVTPLARNLGTSSIWVIRWYIHRFHGATCILPLNQSEAMLQLLWMIVEHTTHLLPQRPHLPVKFVVKMCIVPNGVVATPFGFPGPLPAIAGAAHKNSA